ncbi:MAG: SMP-30/gluconolactonase/LRE family protein [Okeania sp. SIO2D1]|nr:SMP-30/gluconolactonase/LRE family protein [Okeania sp. SIO2D1]
MHPGKYYVKRLKLRLTRGHLEAKLPAFHDLISPQTRIQRLVTGFKFTEGPIWLTEESCLLFSDIPADKIFKLARNGRVKIFREPSHNSNGLTRDREGRLIACEHGSRCVTRTEKDGSITILAEKFQGKQLNSPNDVVVKSDGAIYFTDPPYGIKAQMQEQPVQGVYRLSPNGQKLTLVAKDFERPNGLAFSHDESKLYVDDSSRRHLRVFDVQTDGTLANSCVFHDMNIAQPGSPDGMKIDVAGNIYCTGPGGVWVFDGMGSHLGMIITPEKPANCAWGDEDWQSLYITACTSIYKVRVNIPGIAP